MLRPWRVPLAVGVGKQTTNKKEKIMQFEVRSEEVANIETEKGAWRPCRLTMLGTGDFSAIRGRLLKRHTRHDAPKLAYIRA
jgi:hypothetical protein